MSLETTQLEALTTWLAKQGSQFADITACIQLKGGQSNPTYRLEPMFRFPGLMCTAMMKR